MNFFPGPAYALARPFRALTCLVLAAIVLMATMIPAYALEWVAHRLRGPVHIVIDGEWVPIGRGDTVYSGTIVRTGPSGTVEFRHGDNKVALSPDTQVKFIDWTDRGQTWVQQWFGEVDVDVEVRDVSHFAVQTPMMVAVVKGTRFTVKSTETESSVNVIRGAVAVEDVSRGHHVELGAGQSATGGVESVMSVSGNGNLPVVVTADGRPVTPPAGPPQQGQGNALAAQGGGNRPGAGPIGAPGNSGNTPAAIGDRPGNSGNTPAAMGGRPGNSGNTPAANNGHGNGGNGQGQGNGNAGGNGNGNGNGPGYSGNTPAATGERPGNSGNTPAAANGNGGGNGLLGAVGGLVGGLLGGG